MTDVQQPDRSEPGDQPGDIRTQWHPLLLGLLHFALDSAFKIESEVPVGRMPLRIDVLLLRREGGQLSQARAAELAALLPLLNRFTLIEFKGPTDALRKGDFAQLVGCAFLWHSQEYDLVSCEDLSLVVLAPVVTAAFRDELRALRCEMSLHKPGISRISGLPLAAWVVETDVMAEVGESALSLVSRVFVRDRKSIIEKLARRGEQALAQYRYMVQQVKQFRGEEDIAMQQALSETLEQFEQDLVTKMLQELPVERRLEGLSPEEVLRVMPPEKVLRVVPPEERVRGLSLEERLAGLSEEDAARLRQLVEGKHGR